MMRSVAIFQKSDRHSFLDGISRDLPRFAAICRNSPRVWIAKVLWSGLTIYIFYIIKYIYSIYSILSKGFKLSTKDLYPHVDFDMIGARINAHHNCECTM